jgi:predicted neuraminidase
MLRSVRLFLPLMALIFAAAAPSSSQPSSSKPVSVHNARLITSEFIFDQAPFPSCHASTIVQTNSGQLVAAWFGGTAERNPDVGILTSRRIDGKWTAPVEVANGVQLPDPAGRPVRYPTWNPVLFQPKDAPLMLFYKVGPMPASWWGMVMTSSDDGRTFSPARRLPDGVLGPIKNKPVTLPSNVVLSGSSDESSGWTAHFELSNDAGKNWKKVPLSPDQKFNAIQPTILLHTDALGAPPRLQALCRTKEKVIAETWSSDGGEHWTPLVATSLPNPNSGIDAVTLADGRHLLVYNPVAQGRTPLTLAISRDGAKWTDIFTLEDAAGEYSYPAVIQSRDGLVHITYTYQRRQIKYVVIDPHSIE